MKRASSPADKWVRSTPAQRTHVRHISPPQSSIRGRFSEQCAHSSRLAYSHDSKGHAAAQFVAAFSDTAETVSRRVPWTVYGLGAPLAPLLPGLIERLHIGGSVTPSITMPLHTCRDSLRCRAADRSRHDL